MDRQLLSRATENSNAPTPGYMYIDIAKNAAGNPQTCSEIAKYLTGRLASKNNSNIKFKCLKVISKTAVSPYLRGQFKRCLSQDPQAMSAIKDAMQFRGPPDPVRGDEPYDKVRKAAKEALDAVYSDTPASDMGGSGSGGASFGSSISGGYGNQSGGGYGGAGGPPPGGPRRMEGIGNPMFKDPRLEPEVGNLTVNTIVNEAKSTVMGMIKDPLARNTSITISNNQGSMPRPGGSYSGPSGSFNRPPPGRSDLMHQTNGQWTMASNRGPGAMVPPPNYANDSAYYKSRESGGNYAWAQANSGASSSDVGGSWGSAATPSTSSPYAHQATPSITVNSIPGANSVSGGSGTAAADGSYERQLVIELCPPGGMKPEPPHDKLSQFARIVSSLHPDFVCPVVLDCLEEGQPWIIRAKALWVMETCIQHGKRPGATNNAYADFFHACYAEFAPLANHSRAAIRDPVKRILNSLGVATPVGEVAAPPSRLGATAAAPAAPPPEPVVNLLDFDDEIATVPPSTSAPTPPTVSPPEPPKTPTNATDATNGTLFGGLKLSSMAAPISPTAEPLPATSSGDNLLDLMAGNPKGTASTHSEQKSSFGFINSEATAPDTAEIKEASNMFDNLSLQGSNSVAKTEPAITDVSTGGSAFGFINATGSTGSSTSEKKADGSASTAKIDSFDPLKNITPNSRKAMMQVSPEQMQAMVYQQMMMQQQMQMAQMQMALQQQKRGSSTSQMFMSMPGHVMQNPAASKSTLAFMDQPQKKDDKSFDFVKDAMTTEKKK